MRKWPQDQPRVTSVRGLYGHPIEVSFAEGTIGSLDLTNEISCRGSVFEPLEDAEYFSKVHLNADSGTIQWPNGLDFCLDVLYSLVSGIPILFAEKPAEILP